MKEAMRSHNLRGLSLIADLYLLGGALMIGSSLFLVVLGSILVLIPIGAGVIMIAIGHYLDDLHKFSWWAVIISNFCTLAITSTSVIFFHASIYDIAFVINVVLSFTCVAYLMKRDVRNLFFQK
jgi:hypothetical protein